MEHFFFEKFRRITSLKFMPTSIQMDALKWVYIFILFQFSTKQNFAQGIIGAELLSQQISSTHFKITLLVHQNCELKQANSRQQVVLFEKEIHNTPIVITREKDSTFSHSFAQPLCVEAKSPCAQTQRYTTIYSANQARANYDLIWAYQGLPAGLGNFN